MVIKTEHGDHHNNVLMILSGVSDSFLVSYYRKEPLLLDSGNARAFEWPQACPCMSMGIT